MLDLPEALAPYITKDFKDGVSRVNDGINKGYRIAFTRTETAASGSSSIAFLLFLSIFLY
jgi:hypothetical protein